MSAHHKNRIFITAQYTMTSIHICIYNYWTDTTEKKRCLCLEHVKCPDILGDILLYFIFKKLVVDQKLISWPINECPLQFANPALDHSKALRGVSWPPLSAEWLNCSVFFCFLLGSEMGSWWLSDHGNVATCPENNGESLCMCVLHIVLHSESQYSLWREFTPLHKSVR